MDSFVSGKKEKSHAVLFLCTLLFAVLLSISYCFFIPVRKAIFPKLHSIHPRYASQLQRYVDGQDYENFVLHPTGTGSMRTFYGQSTQNRIRKKMHPPQEDDATGAGKKEKGTTTVCGGPEVDGINCLNEDWVWVKGMCVPKN